jgi:hypothetical protein
VVNGRKDWRMTSVIGVERTIMSTCTSCIAALQSVVPLTLPMLIACALEVALGGAAIHGWRKVNRKVRALTRGSGQPLDGPQHAEFRRRADRLAQ